MKKILRSAAIGLVVLMVAGAMMLWLWMNPPQGRLTLAAALIAKIADARELTLIGQSVDAQRVGQLRTLAYFRAAPAPMAEVNDLRFDGPGGTVHLRRYLPHTSQEALPVILYFHGGGWVFGGLDSHDHVTRLLAKKSGAIVIAVDYRLAPEHRYPAAIDDAWAALLWVHANAAKLGIDPNRIAVAGDSAGGNLAAALTLRARDQKGPHILAQALIYPVTDMTTQERDSYRNYANGFFLTRDRMTWFIDQYVPDSLLRHNAYASPLLAKDHRALPQAIILTAEFDPLRDEGTAYAAALRRADVPTELHNVPGVLHGFVSLDRWFTEAGTATDRLGMFLKAALGANTKTPATP